MKHIQKAISVLFINFFLSGNISFSLPVELHYFVATVNLNDVSLEWGTFTEVTNQGFHIQRKSVDSTIWNDMGFVVGHGTINEPQNYDFTDIGLGPGSYNYRLKQVDFNGEFEYFDLPEEILIKTTSISNLSNFTPDKFILYQNYPNPFNPKTNINYELRITNYVTLKVYDVLGNEVTVLVDKKQSVGSYSIEFNGENYPSGIYYYKLSYGLPSETEKFSEVRKMILTK